MGLQVSGRSCSGPPDLSIPISSPGHSSPLFLSEEVQSILEDYCSEPLPSVGADTLLVNLSSLGSFTPDFFSSDLGEGFSLGGSVSSTELFASRVFEEPMGRTSQEGGSSPSSSGEQREGVFPARKKPKLVRKKRVSSLAIGDGVSMKEIHTYAE